MHLLFSVHYLFLFSLFRQTLNTYPLFTLHPPTPPDIYLLSSLLSKEGQRGIVVDVHLPLFFFLFRSIDTNVSKKGEREKIQDKAKRAKRCQNDNAKGWKHLSHEELRYFPLFLY